MDMTRYVNTFGRYLRAKHGEKVHKISVNASFTCPNRDGSKGIGGCTFCNNDSFSPKNTESGDITDQIIAAKQRVSERTKAKKFIAYFQSYSNTYGDPEDLKRYYDEALSDPDVIGLAVGTRPDCVPDPVLELLSGYQSQGYEVWLELGLQSSFDESLIAINRGHGFAEYVDAVERARKFGLKICTHLIMGLPGEEPEDTLKTFDRVIELGVDAIKVHPLHIVKGTQLARQWKQGQVPELTVEQYTDTLAEIIRRAPKDLLFHRLTGSGERQYLLAPDWVMNKWDVLGTLYRKLEAA
ncbi:TIGR01212 family radical SAM protein [Endozoicomonas sp. OPT23]|uniref:TIGR01212 family radical SAM protein n=1 Tax=Endozoicomonas sp. OPT23 TaxID=2072845 RepID=UPI00129A2B2C|nr:TIGR01212 family radical SAM protein [Endozoicomonas sp. OPT23]MRI32180.1 TIGR01212 family radical SAM protein [Endozoicomonas sp. OPT23]